MSREELIKAIEKRAIEYLNLRNILVDIDTINAAKVGFYQVVVDYLTQEQIDEIVKTHKLEL